MASTELTDHQIQENPSGRSRRQEITVLRTALIYIFPAAVVMALITFWPLIYQFWMSFTNFSNLNLRTDNLLLQLIDSFSGNHQAYNSPSLLGLGNYINIIGGGLAQVLSGFDFWRILLFNLVWTFVNLVFHVSIGVAIAVLLNQKGFLFKRFYRALYIIPWAMPGLVTAMIWNNMFDRQSGGINQVLKLLGFRSDIGWLIQPEPPLTLIPPYVRIPGWANPYLFLFILILLIIVPYFFKWVRRNWLRFTIVWLVVLELFFIFGLTPLLNLLAGHNNPTASQSIFTGLGAVLPLSFYAALITNVWLGWPFMMVVASGALQGIPNDFYEAAEVDGATSWQSFWSITVPMIRPAMVPAIIIGMTLTFNQFNVLYFTTSGGPLHSTEILVTEAYRLVNQTSIAIQGVGNAQPFGVAAAFAFIVFAILATLTLITNRISRATAAFNE
jgi:ABC-type sugar transport system permease subunit